MAMRKSSSLNLILRPTSEPLHSIQKRSREPKPVPSDDPISKKLTLGSASGFGMYRKTVLRAMKTMKRDRTRILLRDRNGDLGATGRSAKDLMAGVSVGIGPPHFRA